MPPRLSWREAPTTRCHPKTNGVCSAPALPTAFGLCWEAIHPPRPYKPEKSRLTQWMNLFAFQKNKKIKNHQKTTTTKNGNQFPSPRSCIVQRTHPSLLKVSSSDQSLTRTQCLSCTATTVAFPYLSVSERAFPVFALIGSSVNSNDPSLCRRPL